MTVISFNPARQSFAEAHVQIEVDARRIEEVSADYARNLAAYAFVAAQPLAAFDGTLMLSAERFILRRGVVRARHAWSQKYGRDDGRQYFAFAEPMIRSVYWSALDHVHPIFCEERGQKMPLVRGWADLDRMGQRLGQQTESRSLS